MTDCANKSLHVLLVEHGHSLPPQTSEYLATLGYKVETYEEYESCLERAKSHTFDAAVLPAPPRPTDSHYGAFQNLMRIMETRGTTAIVLGDSSTEIPDGCQNLVDFASPTISKEEIRGRLSVLLKYHDVVLAFERDLSNMQRLFKQLNAQFSHVDQEMRLAGRLQSAFLPKGVTTFGNANFATLYRPASFVSGDIYDIFRVDEEHVAFYIADAVGHGMAASLLTMFIKNAVVSKKVTGKQYELLKPCDTLELLNQKLCDQKLPNSQFVTACYGLLNVSTLEMSFARAGHPYPMLCSTDGSISELKSSGGLLGLFEDQRFCTRKVKLEKGQKVIIYSDGVELAFAKKADRPDELNHYRKVLADIAQLPADQLLVEFARHLDSEDGSLNPQDDVTLLIVEV